jgi:NAD(P)-dependent dehydrogenase (short-subunit alcohol dehydrogenase family)
MSKPSKVDPTNDDPRTHGPKPPFDEKEQDAPGDQSSMRTTPDCGETTYQGKNRLEGRTALVTGGDSGIGRAVAIAFAREGADVVITHLKEEEDDAKATVAVLRAAGRKARSVATDFSDGSAARRVVEQAIEELGHLDILVNNAAYQGKAVERFEELDADRVRRTFAVNIVAMFDLVREALPHLEKGASIINVASIQAYKPSAEILDYATTKGAIVTFTKGLAESLIPRGIRANAVAPGPVWTPLIVQSFDEKKIRTFGESNPTGRPAQPVELAPAFVFLGSIESTFINGEVLGVTGGLPMG